MKRALILLDVLTLCILVACSSPTLRVYSFELKAPTEAAMSAWNLAFARGPDSCHVDLYWSPDADVFVEFGHPRDGGRGGYNDGLIRVRPDVPPAEQAMVISHELGHALGFDDDRHAPNPEELMHGRQPERVDPEPTGYDVAFVCEAQ